MQNFYLSLNQIYSSYRQAICRIIRENKLDVSMEMLQAMKHLYTEENINQQELADKIFKEKSSLSYLLKNMEQKGYVSRFDDPNDKRNKRIVLTSKGNNLYKQFQLELQQLYSRTSESIGESQLKSCISVLKDINSNLNHA